MKPPHQRSMFDPDSDSDSGRDRSLVQVIAGRKPQNKAQASFQRLIAKIENRRETLQKWQIYELRYSERLASELMPLQARIRAGQRQMLIAIDALLSQPAKGRVPSRMQRVQLEDILVELLDELIDDDDADEALIALFEKYYDQSYAEARESEMAMQQSFLEDLMGVDLGQDHRATNPEELMEHARRKLDESLQHESRREEARRHPAGAAKPGASRKAEAAQAKKEQAANEVRQSIREVYRKLASALHPDREPDAGERQRKTGLIQRVNQAYEAGDLLTLLGLQLEIEQIDAEHLTTVAPERLAHYNQILREQLADLEAEIDHHVLPFREIGIRDRSIDPAIVDRHLSIDIVRLREAAVQLDADLVALQDPRQLGALLKRMHRRAEQDEFIDLELIDLLAQVHVGSAVRGKGKGKRRR